MMVVERGKFLKNGCGCGVRRGCGGVAVSLWRPRCGCGRVCVIAARVWRCSGESGCGRVCVDAVAGYVCARILRRIDKF
jgi:hypothetical protein